MTDKTGARPEKRLVYRHAGVTRATHWINVLALSLLLMSGLQIFNAHPRSTGAPSRRSAIRGWPWSPARRAPSRSA